MKRKINKSEFFILEPLWGNLKYNTMKYPPLCPPRALRQPHSIAFHQDVVLALSEEVHRREAEKKGASIDLPQGFQEKVGKANASNINISSAHRCTKKSGLIFSSSALVLGHHEREHVEQKTLFLFPTSGCQRCLSRGEVEPRLWKPSRGFA